MKRLLITAFASLWATVAVAQNMLTGVGIAVPLAPPQLNAFSLVGHVNTFNNTPNYFGLGQQSQAQGYEWPPSNCIDTTQHLLFTAGHNFRVLVFQLDASNQNVTTLPAYVLGLSSFFTSTQPIPATASNFTPEGIACDSVGHRLFVSDSQNNRVLVFNTNLATMVNGENADFVLGQATFSGASPATTQTGLNQPAGLAYDNANQRLFVVDCFNNRVMVFDVNPATMSNGEPAFYVFGQTDYVSTISGTTQALFSNANTGFFGLDYDPVGVRLMVSDKDNNRIMIFDASPAHMIAAGNGMSAAHVLGQALFSTATAGFTTIKMNTPQAIAYDSVNARLFVVDSGNWRVIMYSGMASVTDGMAASSVIGQTAFTAHTRLATSQTSTLVYSGSQMNTMAVDPVANLLYVPEFSSRVTVFPVASGFSNNPSATWNYGHSDPSNVPQYTAADKQNWPGPQSAFNTNGTILDTKNHRLFVTDYNDAPGTLETGHSPIGARILVYQLDSNDNISSLNAVNVLGWLNFYATVTGGAGQGIFNIHVSGGSYDTVNDRLFISDTANNRVLVFNVAPGTISDGMNASFVLGQTLYTTSTPNTTQAGLRSPKGTAYDAAGLRLFVADSGNNRVMVFNANPATMTNGENALNVLGQALFTTSTPATTQNGMNSPQENMAYDATNNRLFVCDMFNNRVLEFTGMTSITDGMNASHVLGQTLFTTNTPATTQSGLQIIGDDFGGGGGGLDYDQVWGRLFVGDTKNYRTMIFDASISGIANGANALNLLQQSSWTAAVNPQITTGLQNGSGFSGSGAYNPANNSYFDTQWQPDRVVEYQMIHITTASLAAGTSGVAYSAPIAVSQTQGRSRSFSVFSGSLPPGLTLNSSGAIAGTPTTPGSYSFTIEARDNFSTGNFFDRAAYTVVIS